MPSPFFLGPYSKAGVFLLFFEHETKQNINGESIGKVVDLQFSVEIHKIPIRINLYLNFFLCIFNAFYSKNVIIYKLNLQEGQKTANFHFTCLYFNPLWLWLTKHIFIYVLFMILLLVFFSSQFKYLVVKYKQKRCKLSSKKNSFLRFKNERKMPSLIFF